MNFLEKDLETIIWESDNEKLQERGLDINGKKFRQLRIGNYGVLDLMTVERDYYSFDDPDKLYPFLNITVYELKKEKVGISAFLQAIRYCKGIKTYLEKRKFSRPYKLNIVLCAKEVDTSSDFIFLLDFIGNESEYPHRTLSLFEVYSFDYKLEGINFIQHSGYNLTTTGF